MPNSAFEQINVVLRKLNAERTIESGIAVACELLNLAGLEGIKSNDPTSSDCVLLTALKLPNAERYDNWFQAHPKFKSNRACFALNDIKQGSLEAKLYALKKKSRLYVSGAAHFTPNYEDALFTRQDPNAKVGIDFFLPPENDAVLVVLSNNKSLRIVELRDQLTNTQKDIFSKWAGAAALDREQLHLTIWDSFKLKSINEAFYKGISNSFKHLVSHLIENGKDENQARHFANRLHGRLLFCWFLDKKGFINREINYFDTTHTDAIQHYKEKLELLFFDTLNTPQSERERSHPDRKTPYLNGGLFEAQPDDWQGSNIPFPQGFFINLYKHFSEFNFTTDESTPDYEQIAIDPEMLGRIFENLLAEINEETGEQARKAKGAFYTPREIVAYMCRESIREYLYTATKVGEKGKNSINRLLDTPDSDWAKSGTNSKRDTVEPALREKIVKALDEMKVLDPACGSGAFPIGMLHLLVQIYERLDARFDPYKTKLGIMERNIYGVDIEPLAIEIARLRSFLALVVDQEYMEKKPNGGIDTLPNLEFKFVCANTLIPLTKQGTLGEGGKYETLLSIKKEYFKASPKQREKLETKYTALRQQGTMFDSQLNEQLSSYDPFNNDHPATFYDQHLMHDITNAFDVVIGNPPYVQLQKNGGRLANLYEHVNYVTFARTGDIYALFYERGLGLTKDRTGLLCYITSNKWMRAGYGEMLRDFFATKDPILLIDFGGFKVFDSATVDTNILLIHNAEFSGTFKACHMENDFVRGASIGAYVSEHDTEIRELSNESWFIGNDAERLLKAKIESRGTPLKDWNVKINFGIKTGYNKAFIIDETLYTELIKVCNEEERDCFRKVVHSSDIKQYAAFEKHKYLIFIPWHFPLNQTNFSSKHSLTDAENVFSVKFPNIYSYLKCHENELRKRNPSETGVRYEWYALQRCAANYLDDFNYEKIVWREITSEPSFCLVPPGVYVAAPATFLVSEENIKYLLAFLNSNLVLWYFGTMAHNLGASGLEWKKAKIEQLPIPLFDKSSEIANQIVEKVQTLEKSESDLELIKYQINQLIYQLYNLTPEEIAIIENS